jgi:hypothetical protein
MSDDIRREVKKFGKVPENAKHRIKEARDTYQAENKFVLDFSDTEYIKKSTARELLGTNIPMRLSEPVKRMMEVVSNE